MKKCKRVFLLWFFAFPFLNLICEVSVASFDRECKTIMGSLDNKIYTLLSDYDNQKSLEEAIDLLNTSKSSCGISPEWDAQLYDLRGYVATRTYKFSGRKYFYDDAVQSFQKALELNTSRSEYVYYHMAGLMRQSKEFAKGIGFINKALNFEPQPKDPLPYLKLAFQLAVDVKDWKAAGDLMEIVTKRDSYHFYENPDLILSMVEAFCYHNELAPARILIEKNEKYMIDTKNQNNETWRALLNEAKKIADNCPVPA